MRSICVGKQLKTVFNFNLSGHEGQQHRRKLNQTLLYVLCVHDHRNTGSDRSTPVKASTKIGEEGRDENKVIWVGDQLSRATCIANATLQCWPTGTGNGFSRLCLGCIAKCTIECESRSLAKLRSCMQNWAAKQLRLMDSKTYTRKPFQSI